MVHSYQVSGSNFTELLQGFCCMVSILISLMKLPNLVFGIS